MVLTVKVSYVASTKYKKLETKVQQLPYIFNRKGVAHLWKNEGVAPLRELLYNSYLNLCFNYWNELKCSPVLVVPQVLQATEFIGTSLCFSFCVSSEK